MAKISDEQIRDLSRRLLERFSKNVCDQANRYRAVMRLPHAEAIRKALADADLVILKN